MLFANYCELNTTVTMRDMDTITTWYSSGLHCRTDFLKV